MLKKKTLKRIVSKEVALDLFTSNTVAKINERGNAYFDFCGKKVLDCVFGNKRVAFSGVFDFVSNFTYYDPSEIAIKVKEAQDKIYEEYRLQNERSIKQYEALIESMVDDGTPQYQSKVETFKNMIALVQGLMHNKTARIIDKVEIKNIESMSNKVELVINYTIEFDEKEQPMLDTFVHEVLSYTFDDLVKEKVKHQSKTGCQINAVI